MTTLRRFLRSQSGMETVEWAVVAVIIVAVVVLAFRGIGTAGAERMSGLNDTMSEKKVKNCPNPPCADTPPCGSPPCGGPKK